MSNAQETTLDRDMLVLTDQAGNHFLLPVETLERGRVPEEHRAELERLLAAAAETGEVDTQGYAGAIIGALLVTSFYAGLHIGFGVVRYFQQEEQTVPSIDLGSIGSGEPLPEY